MFKIVVLVLVLTVAAIAGGAYKFGFILNDSPTEPVAAKSVYEFQMRDIDGKDVKLDTFKGKVVMIVNTASECGFTPQYAGLQSLFGKYREKGFVVLGFPANNFMGQEPGTEAQIKEFCTLKYKVTFPMFAKISVKGADQHPLYNFLTNKATDPDFSGEISWNFNKFLIDRNGKVVARFGSEDTPESEAVTFAVEKYISAK